ncbi:hypothetical protein ACA910_003792 [Epithemia clementina (nom. ined.)]
MDVDDDPYTLLGVSRDASTSQIRSAYRKAALQHHPDRVAPEDKATANVLFAKISNAYELLSDETKRAEFDQQQFNGGAVPNQHEPNHCNNNHNFHDFHHPHHSSHFDNHFRHHFHFHDPFEVFRHVFREEFGGPSAGFGNSARHQHNPHAHPMMSPFMNDPFFADPFGRGMPSARGGSIFSQFDDMFDSMHQSIQNDMMHPPAGNGSNFSVISSSSTSTTFGGPGGESVTTQTTRRIVNGQEETVTERIVRKADGTVHREVLHNNGNNNARIEQPQHQQQALENGLGHHQQQQHSGFLPWRRRSSKQRERPRQEQAPR